LQDLQVSYLLINLVQWEGSLNSNNEIFRTINVSVRADLQSARHEYKHL
jgi:hypothetical protein